MSDDFSPDLNGLEPDYKVLTELRRLERSRSYLARHVGLNRDVVLTVLAAVRNDDDNSLAHFASDARSLATMRHPNVVPVVEARWLADGSLAIVRARVRGTTLDETTKFGEPPTLSAIGEILSQVDSAIEWARGNGIVHRHLPGDGVLIQQGSGRVLVELDLSPVEGGGYSDASVDARTIGRLAYAMFARRAVADTAPESLTDIRSDLSAPVIRELTVLIAADRLTPPRDPKVLIALLKREGGNGVAPVSEIVSAPVEAASPAPLQAPKPEPEPAPVAAAPTPLATPPAPQREPVTESGFKRRFGFGLR